MWGVHQHCDHADGERAPADMVKMSWRCGCTNTMRVRVRPYSNAVRVRVEVGRRPWARIDGAHEMSWTTRMCVAVYEHTITSFVGFGVFCSSLCLAVC